MVKQNYLNELQRLGVKDANKDKTLFTPRSPSGRGEKSHSLKSLQGCAKTLKLKFLETFALPKEPFKFKNINNTVKPEYRQTLHSFRSDTANY